MKLIEQLTKIKKIMEINSHTFSGDFVWNHIVNITPDEENIPWGFKKTITNTNFILDDNFNIKSLLDTDSDFKEYYMSADVRYLDDEVDSQDLNYEIVVVDGQLLDGYSRVKKLLKNGVTNINAFTNI